MKTIIQNNPFSRLLSPITKRLNAGDERSVMAKRNITGSFANKGLSILVNLAIVPITIGYLDSFMYGIWLTLSSIVAWVSYFDMGLGHGFKNKMAEAIARNDNKLIKEYISTTYAILAIIFAVVIAGASIVNQTVDWAVLLNIPHEYGALVRQTVSIIVITVGISQVLNVIGNILTAYQQSALSAFIATLGQCVALISIFVLTLLPIKSIIYISWAFTGAPIFVSIIATLYLFMGRFKAVRPALGSVKFSLIGDILGLGGKFFVIQLSMLVIFQMVNFIVTRVLGAEAVTQYNVAYKYFSILQMIFMIILSPYWVAVTDAYAKRDYAWLNKTTRQINKVFSGVVGIELILLLISPIAFKLWIGDSVQISWQLSIAMAAYIVALSYSNMYMIFINGIGKIFLQSVIYLLFACISIPMSFYLCNHFGLIGILILLTTVYLAQAIVARIQIAKLVTETAHGMWNK